MNVKTIIEDAIGLVSGRMIYQNMERTFAPSILAASINSSGIPVAKFRASRIENGSCSAAPEKYFFSKYM